MTDLESTLAAIRACRLCRDAPRYGTPLPHEPRPVLRIARGAPVLIAGQAPGTRVHGSGMPFTDPSGDRLREWLGIGADVFYDEARVAIVPMGFCFPGHDGAGGDLPPRRECAATWHARLFDATGRPRVVIALGRPAHAWHLARWGLRAHLAGTVSATVETWREILDASADPRVFALPHPSWRNNAWLARHPWFARDLLPELRRTVQDALVAASQPGAGRRDR